MFGRKSAEIERLLLEVEELKQISRVDPLTMLLNRRGIVITANKERMRVDRQKSESQIVAFDLIGLRATNQSLGHMAGDRRLFMFGNFLTSNGRRSDSHGRWGGDEFVSILPDTPLVQAMIWGGKIIDLTGHSARMAVGSLSSNVSVAETITTTLDRAKSEAKRHGSKKEDREE